VRAVTKRRFRLLFLTLSLSVVIGVMIGSAIGSMHGPPLSRLAVGALSGAITAAILAVVIGGAEIFLPQTRLGQALDRAPFVVAFAAKWILYSGAIVIVLGSMVGPHVAALLLRGRERAQALDAQMMTAPAALGIVVSFLVAFTFSLVFELGDLIGRRNLRDVVLGRYHRSRIEERFFLFIDVAGSTSLAERVGPDGVHRFLGEVFRLASDPIEEHGGEIYQYVGDEMVITWSVAAGRVGARAAASFFAVERALAQSESTFEREFGTVPRLRAALHAGRVITGEVGGSRRAIVYHGDVMNTTSRIEQATRDLDRQFLASSDALERFPSLDDLMLEDLGFRHLRGRAAPIRVYAISPKSLTTDDERPGDRHD
jgi:adenylate cyclase